MKKFIGTALVLCCLALPLAGCEDAISTVTSTTMSELEDIPNQILATPESAEMKPEYNYIHFRYDNIWTVSALVNYEIVDNGQNIKFEINDSRYRDKVFYTSMSNVELVYRDDSVDYGTDYTICPGNASEKDNIFEITISEDADEEGKHPLLISGSLNDYPVTSLKSLLKSLTTTIDQYEQPQHPKAQKDAAHINKHAMHIVRLYYTAFDILEKGEIITHRDKEREELLAIRNGKYLREDGSYAPEFFEFVDALEKRFQYDVKKTALPAKPDCGKIEELLVEINKSYLRRVI